MPSYSCHKSSSASNCWAIKIEVIWSRHALKFVWKEENLLAGIVWIEVETWHRNLKMKATWISLPYGFLPILYIFYSKTKLLSIVKRNGFESKEVAQKHQINLSRNTEFKPKDCNQKNFLTLCLLPMPTNLADFIAQYLYPTPTKT